MTEPEEEDEGAWSVIRELVESALHKEANNTPPNTLELEAMRAVRPSLFRAYMERYRAIPENERLLAIGWSLSEIQLAKDLHYSLANHIGSFHRWNWKFGQDSKPMYAWLQHVSPIQGLIH